MVATEDGIVEGVVTDESDEERDGIKADKQHASGSQKRKRQEISSGPRKVVRLMHYPTNRNSLYDEETSGFKILSKMTRATILTKIKSKRQKEIVALRMTSRTLIVASTGPAKERARAVAAVRQQSPQKSRSLLRITVGRSFKLRIE
jgi:hypothetical protein